MGYRDNRSRIRFQMLFEPLDCLGIQVVGRFVKQKQIGLFDQQFAQRDAPPFTTRQL